MKKYQIILTAILLTCYQFSFGQISQSDVQQKKIDSIKLDRMTEAAKRYPLLRQVFTGIDVIGQRDINATMNGASVGQGKYTTTRYFANFNLPLAQWKKNSLTASVSYLYLHNTLTEFSTTYPDLRLGSTIDKSTAGITISYKRADTLWGHPVNLLATIGGLTGSTSSIQDVGYTFTAVFPLISRPATTLSVGASAIIDPAAFFPVLPIVSYWHKFDFQQIELYADLPRRVALRKQLSKKSWVMLGSQLGGSISFFRFDSSFLPQDATHATLELKTGPTYEYQLTRKFIVGVNGGLFSTLSSRTFEQDKGANNYFLKNSSSQSYYFNVTLSFLPFH